jgi:hypothetical protein
VSITSSSNTINQSGIRQIQERMSRGTSSSPKLAGAEIRQPFRTINSYKTNFRPERANFNRGIPNEKMHRCTFEKEVNFSPRGISNVPTKEQFSSFYVKPSSLLTPYILLQPEINVEKIIWHMSKVYGNLINSQKSSTVCTLAFCKELLIRIRPELETYIFMIIKNSEVLYYKYFFLYILQLDECELCWQVTLQPSFLLEFKTFLYSVIKPELNHYLINFRERKVIQAIGIIQNYVKLINSQDKIMLSEHQEIIRRIFVYYQSGFNFKYFDYSFFYWTAKMAILLRIFIHLDWESIRTLKGEHVHSCIKELEKEGRSSYIP